MGFQKSYDLQHHVLKVSFKIRSDQKNVGDAD